MPRSPRVACVGHALKESLTAQACLQALVAGVREAGCAPVAQLCVSDGGDGFLEAALATFSSAEVLTANVHAPHRELITAKFALVQPERQALIESAEAVGMRRVPPPARRILDLGTGGLGELIVHAWNAGAKDFLVGLGGSATCDGGLGMLGVLNDIFVGGKSLEEVGWLVARDLASPPSIKFDTLREALRDAGMRISVAVDVDSPLLGPRGAARRFAPQKGASPSEVEWLEHHMGLWAEHVASALGVDVHNRPGAGAAGGLGFAFLAVGARLGSGATLFLDLPAYLNAIEEADVILTAEGRFDVTSFGGKAPWQVAQAARRRGKQVAIFCALADDEAVKKAHQKGVAIVQFGAGFSFEESRAQAFELLSRAVEKFLAKHR